MSIQDVAYLPDGVNEDLLQHISQLITYAPNYRLIQAGGDTESITIDGNKLFYNLKISYELEDSEKKNIFELRIYQFVGQNSCLALTIDKIRRIARLIDLIKFEDCYRTNPNVKNLNMVDMVKIVIKLCTEMNITQLELADNSSYKCPNTGVNIHLLEARTLTHGFPWYYQFGFIPKDRKKNGIQFKNCFQI